MLSSLLRPAVCGLSLLLMSTACSGETKPAAQVAIQQAFPQLSVKRPVALTHFGDGSGRVVVASQLGTLYVLSSADDRTEPQTLVDLSDRVIYKDRENEEGFLGLAFHPNYRTNGQMFVYYTTADAEHTSVISRFRVSPNDPNRIDPDSEKEILRIKQPFWNHNGGTIAFGPDGYLYVGLGDGGMANDPMMNGQNLQTLLGSILRIDVDRTSAGRAYSIPEDNPFVGHAPLAREEIWAYGLRNVWRLAFDRQTGMLWAADVGQDTWEEINLITRGGNYGWNLREGRHAFGPGGSAARKDLIEPIWEYHHDVGKSITGGCVYRGRQAPSLNGAYLYADYVTGQVWALRYDHQSKQVVRNEPIPGNTMPVLSFREDEAGEVYFLTDKGTIHRFVETRQ